jgi:chromosome segregation ATPase
MSEENTKDPAGARSFEERLFAELGAISTRVERIETRLERLETPVERIETRVDQIDVRLISLSERVEERLYDTRPMWETVQASIARLDDKFDLLIQDLYEIRTDVRVHDKQLKEHERRLNS